MGTVGSDSDTVLTVHTEVEGPPTAPTAAQLTEVACNDDTPTNFQSELEVAVTAGTQYWIRITGFQGETGTLQLILTATAG